MPVIERRRKTTEKTSEHKNKKFNEKQAKEFVSEGISPEDKKFLSFTIKIPISMAKEIDEICKKQCAYISRRSWIVQAASEKLETVKE